MSGRHRGSRGGKGTHTIMYHYTDEQGAQGIRQSGRIKPAPQDPSSQHQKHGNGVYFTKKPPSEPKADLAKNNYRSGWNKALTTGRVDHVVEVHVPKQQVKQCSAGDSRDVWIKQGQGLDLNKYQHRFMKTD